MVNFPPGVYTLEIAGSSGNKQTSFTVDVELRDPCPTVDLNLQTSPFVDATYVLYEPGMEQAWTPEELIAPLTSVNCGPITVEFFNDDLSPLDPFLFAVDTVTAPSNYFRTLENGDESTDGPYPIRYRVYHTNYPTNVVEQQFPFTITIVRSCANPQTLVPSVLVNQEYTVTDVPVPYVVPAFIYTPTYCDLIYSFSVE